MCLTCVLMSLDPLRRHAQEFCNLVDRTLLAPALYSKELLNEADLETLRLQSMIDSDKLAYLLTKLVHLDRDGFVTFMDCLSNASEHPGHSELHKMLSKY